MPVANRTARLLGFAVFLSFLVSCGPAATPEPLAPPDSAGTETPAADSEVAVSQEAQSSAWDEFVTQTIEDFLAAHPAFAVFQGRHEYDGILPNWSAEGIAREIARLKQTRENALAFSEQDLGDAGQYQREYLLAAIDRSLFWLDKAEWPFVNPAFYFDWMSDSLDPSPYIAGALLGYLVGWLRQEENQYLSAPPEIAKTFPDRLQRLIGYDLHGVHLGWIDAGNPHRLLEDDPAAQGRVF